MKGGSLSESRLEAADKRAAAALVEDFPLSDEYEGLGLFGAQGCIRFRP